MACNCTVDVNTILQSIGCDIASIKEAIVPLIDEIAGYCCFGVTLTENPITDPAAATTEAFPDGIGSTNCTCPIAWIFDVNGNIYYSIDDGVSWTQMPTPNTCVINLDVSGDINDQNNEVDAGYLLAIANGCLLIFAKGSDGVIYSIRSDQAAGDGGVGNGEWCTATIVP